MGGLLFVSQAMLDGWAEQGKIDLSGNVITLLAGEGKGRSYALDPALRFLRVVGGDTDAHGLLHKVKSASQLRALGAEAVDDSCILGETAYEVMPGFLAEGAAVQAAAAAPTGRGNAPSPSAPAADGGELERRRKEAEALARFLLENL